MNKSIDGVKEAAAVIFMLAFIFAGCAHLNDLSRFRPDLLMLGAGWGGFVGLASVPYFNKKFTPRPFLCGVFAAALGGGAAWWFGASLLAIVGVVSGTAILGYFAPSWARRVQF